LKQQPSKIETRLIGEKKIGGPLTWRPVVATEDRTTGEKMKDGH
jgi:hypothetical protein